MLTDQRVGLAVAGMHETVAVSTLDTEVPTVHRCVESRSDRDDPILVGPDLQLTAHPAVRTGGAGPAEWCGRTSLSTVIEKVAVLQRVGRAGVDARTAGNTWAVTQRRPVGDDA